MSVKRADAFGVGDRLEASGQTVVTVALVPKTRFVDVAFDDGTVTRYAVDYRAQIVDPDWRDVALGELAADPVIEAKVRATVERLQPVEVDITDAVAVERER